MRSILVAGVDRREGAVRERRPAEEGAGETGAPLQQAIQVGCVVFSCDQLQTKTKLSDVDQSARLLLLVVLCTRFDVSVCRLTPVPQHPQQNCFLTVGINVTSRQVDFVGFD